MRRWLRLVLCAVAWSGVGTGLAAPGVSDPTEAVDLYDGGSVDVTVTNDQSKPVTATFTLLLPGQINTAIGSAVTVPAGSALSVRLPIDLPATAEVRRQLQAQLLTAIAVPANGSAKASTVLSTLPVTVRDRSTLISTWAHLLWVPPVLALLLVGGVVLLRRAMGKPSLSPNLQAGDASPGKSWLTNLTVLSALGTGIVGTLTLDATNAALATAVLAVVVVLLATGPLLYQSAVRANDTAPGWALLASTFITVTAAALALVLIVSLAPTLTDVAGTLGITGATTGQGAAMLQRVAILLGGLAALFTGVSLSRGLDATTPPPAAQPLKISWADFWTQRGAPRWDGLQGSLDALTAALGAATGDGTKGKRHELNDSTRVEELTAETMEQGQRAEAEPLPVDARGDGRLQTPDLPTDARQAAEDISNEEPAWPGHRRLPLP